MQIVREKLTNLLAGGEGVNRRLVVLVALATAALVAILVALNSARSIESPDPAPSVRSSVSVQLPSNYVHVSGEVKQPGVYQLPSGSRLFEAIFAAGGFTENAEQSSVNLAREINDGEQIMVLAKGQEIATGGPTTKPKVSLNRGSQSELETLPGIGPTLASRLIDWRTTNGGFKKIDDLKRVSGFGNKLFAQLKNLVTL